MGLKGGDAEADQAAGGSASRIEEVVEDESSPVVPGVDVALSLPKMTFSKLVARPDPPGKGLRHAKKLPAIENLAAALVVSDSSIVVSGASSASSSAANSAESATQAEIAKLKEQLAAMAAKDKNADA